MGNAAKYIAQIKRVDLSKKVTIVTGANTGIGYITARELAKMGSRVFVACRSKERADEAIQKMKAESTADLLVEFLPLDLGSLKSIEACVAEFKSRNLPLHLLINNAGIMALPQLTRTEDGFESQLGVNHVGHFHLTTLLLPILQQSAPGRIVNLSSMAHSSGKIRWEDPMFNTEGYTAFGAYGQSKLANILFTKELQRRFDEEHVPITTYAVHPGFVNTELMRNVSAPAVIKDFVGNVAAKTVEEGALTSIRTACDPDIEGPKFGGLYWADCEVKEPADTAKNMEDAKRLWDLTEKLIAVAKQAKSL